MNAFAEKTPFYENFENRYESEEVKVPILVKWDCKVCNDILVIDDNPFNIEAINVILKIIELKNVKNTIDCVIFLLELNLFRLLMEKKDFQKCKIKLRIVVNSLTN